MTKKRNRKRERAEYKRIAKEMAKIAKERKEELPTLNHELDIFKK